MKKLFLEPEMDVMIFGVEDILTSSDWIPGEDELPGDLLTL